MGKRRARRDDEIAAEAAALAEEATVVWRVLVWYKSGSEPFFGAPVRCPQCGQLSLVLKVDMRDGRCRNRCTPCGIEFVLTQRAMQAVTSGRMPIPDHLRPQSEAPATVYRGEGELPPVLVAPDQPMQRLARHPDDPSLPPEPVESASVPPPVEPAAAAPPAPPAPPVEPAAAAEVPMPAPPAPPVEPAASEVPLPAPPPAPTPHVEPAAASEVPLPADPEDAAVAADRAHAASRAAEAGRRNRRQAALARRARQQPNDEDPAAPEPVAAEPVAAEPAAAEPVASEPVASELPSPDPVASESIAPATASSLFSAPRPEVPDDDAPPRPHEPEVLPSIAVSVAPADAGPAVPGGDGEVPVFGPVVVTAGDSARLIAPGAAVPVTVDATPPVPAEIAGPPATDGLPVLARRAVPSGPPLRVLLVEDDPGDAALLLSLVGGSGPEAADVRVARTLHAAQATAQDFQPDIVLLDLDLPDSHGLATITRWCFSDMPGRVVVTSGDYTESIESKGREQGVADFLPKSKISELLDAGDDGASEVITLLREVTERSS